MISRVEAIAKQRSILTGEVADRAIGIIFFLWATALSAYVYVPVPGTPVPITLQTFFVLLAGALLRRTDSLAAMFGYVILGAVGLPFFAAGQAGVGYVLGPTAGYLAGFVAAAAVMSRLLSAGDAGFPSLPKLMVAMAVGIVVIYACGAVWLGMLMRMPWAEVWRAGITPFIVPDAGKLAAAAIIVRRYQVWRGRAVV